MHIFIAKLIKKDITTKDGRKTAKYTIITDENKYFDSWSDDWNKEWKEGMTLEVNEAQIDKREFNGKIYSTIKPPTSRAAAQNLAVNELKDQLALQTQLLKDVEKMVKVVYDYVIQRNTAK